MRAVHSELRQHLPTSWHGGSPPCSEAGARENSPGLHLPLHQGTRDYTPYHRCLHHHCFPPGVRDEKMLEKLATHDVKTVTTLFALAYKCARATEGRAWHSAPQTGVAQMGGSGAVARDGKKKKKNRGLERPPSAAPIIAAVTGGRSERNKHPRPQRGNNAHVPYTPTVATTPRCVARSSSSRSTSASGASRLPRMAPHLVAGLARKGSTTARWPRENGTSGISHPRGF
jgi:hypothetical protein